MGLRLLARSPAQDGHKRSFDRVIWITDDMYSANLGSSAQQNAQA